MIEESRGERTRRRLTVVLASDVAGYSRLISEDEEGTVTRFTRVAAEFRRLVEAYNGRVFNTAGDAILAEFSSAVEAVRCALDVHEVTGTENLDQVPGRFIQFRIGIAVGDVILAENGDLLGDGVNIAARLQSIADVGGTCISNEIWGHVRGKLDVQFKDLGLRPLKNIPSPVHAFAVAGGSPTDLSATKHRRPERWIALAAGAAIVATALVVATGVALLRQHRPSAPGLLSSAQVPFVSDEERRFINDQFAKAPAHKAIFLARNSIGLSSGINTREDALLEAFSRCNTRPNSGCEPYAADDELLWKKALIMPLPTDLRNTPNQTRPNFELLPLLSISEARYAETSYNGASKPKALAFGNRGLIGEAFGTANEDEAIRRALERCADRNDGACLLYAVGDATTQPLPNSHKPVGLFLLTNETGIPSDQKAGLAATYGKGDWRAMVRGSAHWYAVSGALSETEAVDKAEQSCRVAETGCTLYAIGNFLVVP